MKGITRFEQYREFRKARSAHKAERKSETLELKAHKNNGKGKKTAMPKFDPRYEMPYGYDLE